MKLSERAAFLVDGLDLPGATGYDGARWEHFQLAHLNDDSTFRIENKSRQIAWSWLAAAEGIACAALYGESSAYVSINLDEATEKIRYAKQILDHLQISGLPKLIRDNDLGLEFANGARILSLPARPPRGKARMRVYLDEYAHVQFDQEIYRAALPIISKGGVLRIGSSPFGATGVFWEIFSQKLKPYPGYVRHETPWWEVYAFCVDVRAARHEAAHLTTAQRVERFGNERIKIIYANMAEDDFQQEYECVFVDESVAWLTWEEIRQNQTEIHCWIVNGVDATLSAIDSLIDDIQAGRMEVSCVGGVDIGRTHDTTEIALLGVSTTGTFPLRMLATLDRVRFEDQQDVLAAIMQKLPIFTLLIDKTGLGMNLAEALEERFPTKAQGVTFTGPLKALWATDAKMLLQQRKTPLPVERDLAYQMHSIKRLITPSKNLIFDTDANEKHHADKFWAWALAVAAVRSPLLAPPVGDLAQAFAWAG